MQLVACEHSVWVGLIWQIFSVNRAISGAQLFAETFQTSVLSWYLARRTTTILVHIEAWELLSFPRIKFPHRVPENLALKSEKGPTWVPTCTPDSAVYLRLAALGFERGWAKNICLTKRGKIWPIADSERLRICAWGWNSCSIEIVNFVFLADSYLILSKWVLNLSTLAATLHGYALLYRSMAQSEWVRERSFQSDGEKADEKHYDDES